MVTEKNVEMLLKYKAAVITSDASSSGHGIKIKSATVSDRNKESDTAAAADSPKEGK
jgi:hypothetical protein